MLIVNYVLAAQFRQVEAGATNHWGSGGAQQKHLFGSFHR